MTSNVSYAPEALLERARAQFRDNHADDENRLRTEISAGQIDAARRRVHALRGAAATLGLDALSGSAAQLEALLDKTGPAPLPQAQAEERHADSADNAQHHEGRAPAEMLDAPLHAGRPQRPGQKIAARRHRDGWVESTPRNPAHSKGPRHHRHTNGQPVEGIA